MYKRQLSAALAPELAPAPGAVVLRSDVERKMLFGKDEHDKLPEAAYSPAVTSRVYATVADKARRALLRFRKHRIDDRRMAGRDASDADAAVARRQETYDLGALDWTRIDASGSPEETFARARTAMGQ